MTGQVRLTNGLLAGLSQLARSGPVVLDWDDGAVRIAAGLMIKGLGVPFSGEASVRDIKVNPDVNTRVDNVGVDFGIQVIKNNRYYSFIPLRKVSMSQSET